jgi:hypothetical protein
MALQASQEHSKTWLHRLQRHRGSAAYSDLAALAMERSAVYSRQERKARMKPLFLLKRTCIN